MKLFHRLLASYFFVVLVVLAVLALVLSGLLSSFIYREQQQRLAETGRSISELVAEGRVYELRRTLLAMDQAVDARIWIVDLQGRVTIDSRGSMMQRRVQFNIPDQILAGKETFLVLEVEDLEADMLLVGIPVFFNGQVEGAVLMLTPVSDVQATLSSIYRLFWPAAAVSLLAAAAIALLVSRSISRPLAGLSRASAALAEGDFSQEVPVEGPGEIRRLAASFNHMASQLRRLEDMRRDFIASVSHELRTPMTSIRGFVQGVLEGKVPRQKQRQYLELTLSEIRRLSRLVSDLLDLSALEGKETPLELVPTDLREVVNLSVAAMEPQLAQHGTKVNIDMPETAVAVRADKMRLQQVFINLIANSISHTSPGVSLDISVEAGSPHTVTVADTGPGIGRDDLENIFKPFYRTRGSGSGLGLAIARALVNAHGGTIRAESSPAGGSRFIVELPGD